MSFANQVKNHWHHWMLRAPNSCKRCEKSVNLVRCSETKKTNIFYYITLWKRIKVKWMLNWMRISWLKVFRSGAWALGARPQRITVVLHAKRLPRWLQVYCTFISHNTVYGPNMVAHSKSHFPALNKNYFTSIRILKPKPETLTMMTRRISWKSFLWPSV